MCISQKICSVLTSGIKCCRTFSFLASQQHTSNVCICFICFNTGEIERQDLSFFTKDPPSRGSGGLEAPQ